MSLKLVMGDLPLEPTGESPNPCRILNPESSPLLVPLTAVKRIVAIGFCVCLSVCTHVAEITCPDFTNFSWHITCGCGSVLVCCDMIVDDVQFCDDARFQMADPRVTFPAAEDRKRHSFRYGS